MSDALETNAEELAEAIRRRVPVEHGDLRDSVGWARGRRGKRATGGDEARDLSVTVFEGDDAAFYATFVEHGTADRTAQPHFFPTYRSLKRRLKSRLSRAVGKAIREAK